MPGYATGPFGTYLGYAVPTVGFQVVAVGGSLPANHYGAFTGTFWVLCSDGRISNKYTALVVMP